MKKALIIIGITLAVILIVAAVLPSSSFVERTVVIDAPVEVVFDQVNDLKKNFNWSPWVEYDPDMEVEWGDVTSGTGASYSWSGNSDVGSGTLTIVESIENELIKNNVDFGDMGIGKAIYKFKTLENESGKTKQVEVSWGIESQLDWPLGRYFGLFMDGLIGPDFEKGLNNLKVVSESLPVEEKIEVTEVDVQTITILSIRDSIAIADIGSRMGEMYGELVGFLEKNKLEMISAPLCLYHVWNMDGGYTIMEAGLPVAGDTKIKPENGISLTTIPSCRAAKVIHTGPYQNLNKAHFAIDAWINENAKTISGSPFEVYLSDPQTETDSTKWITEVYYPVK